MDYEITNKFSDALKYSDPPSGPIPTPVLINHLNDAALFLHEEEPRLSIFRARRMYVACFASYLLKKGIREVVPDETFFEQIAKDIMEIEVMRKECETPKSYSGDSIRAIPRTIRHLVNNYFYPRRLTSRLICRLNAKDLEGKGKLSKLSDPFSRKEFINLVHKANEAAAAGLKKETFEIWKRHIENFERYLSRNEILSLIPDEAFLLKCSKELQTLPLETGFKGSAKNPYYSTVVKARAVREIRIMTNRYFLPKGIIRRPILLGVVRKRYERFFALTKKTQQAIAWFEDHGKAVKAIPVYVDSGNGSLNTGLIRYIYRITDKKLLPNTVYGKINHVLNFLKIAGKNGIESVNESDLKKFIEHCEGKKLSQKQDYLAHTATFFINVHAQGFIPDHPFKQVSLKMNVSSVRIDFIPQEGIDFLMGPSSFDPANPVEVRNATACRLAYDTGLRLGELYGLNVKDITTDSDGDMYVSLDEGIQKGHKPKNLLYLLLDETKSLLRYYLEKSRPTLKPKDDALFVSIHDKKRLCKETLALQINTYLKTKGIKTFYKRKATCHHLRHSFATLNIEPLGLGLSLYQIVERLRHSKQETALKHYIHNNPYLQKRKFEAFKNRIKKKTGLEILRGIPLADFEAFLIENMKMDPEFVKAFRRKHQIMTAGAGDNAIDSTDKMSKISAQASPLAATLTLDEVEKRMKPLGIHLRRLVEYTAKNGLYIKRGREHFFVDSFIDELTEEWVRKEEVMETFGLSRRRFYQLIDEKKWQTLKLGKTLLLKLKKLVQSTQNRMPVMQ